jgi:hypothetical protein
MSLTQAAYTSRARRSFNEQDLDEMLATARIKNKALGLSGLLLYQDGLFLQVLEGHRHAVDDLLKTIEADERHDAVRLIWHREIDARDFGDWQMGFLRSKEAWSQAGFVDILEILPKGGIQFDERGTRAHQLIDVFKESQLRERVCF